MEKKIEKMKKEMNGQIRFYSALSLLGLFTVCLLSSGTLTALYTDSHIADFVHGFLIGLIIVASAKHENARRGKNFETRKTWRGV